MSRAVDTNVLVRCITRDDPVQAALADMMLASVVATGSISLDHEAGVRWAIDRSRNRADFADMIHLVNAVGADRFVTLDRQLAQQAGETRA